MQCITFFHMISNLFGLISFKVHQFPRKNANCTKKMTPAAKINVVFPFYLLLFLTFLWLLTQSCRTDFLCNLLLGTALLLIGEINWQLRRSVCSKIT